MLLGWRGRISDFQFRWFVFLGESSSKFGGFRRFHRPVFSFENENFQTHFFLLEVHHTREGTAHQMCEFRIYVRQMPTNKINKKREKINKPLHNFNNFFWIFKFAIRRGELIFLTRFHQGCFHGAFMQYIKSQVKLRMELVETSVDVKLNNQPDLIHKSSFYHPSNRNKSDILSPAKKNPIYLLFIQFFLKLYFSSKDCQKQSKMYTLPSIWAWCMFCLEIIINHISYIALLVNLHQFLNPSSVNPENPNHTRLKNPTQLSQTIKVCAIHDNTPLGKLKKKTLVWVSWWRVDLSNTHPQTHTLELGRPKKRPLRANPIFSSSEDEPLPLPLSPKTFFKYSKANVLSFCLCVFLNEREETPLPTSGILITSLSTMPKAFSILVEGLICFQHDIKPRYQLNLGPSSPKSGNLCTAYNQHTTIINSVYDQFKRKHFHESAMETALGFYARVLPRLLAIFMINNFNPFVFIFFVFFLDFLLFLSIFNDFHCQLLDFLVLNFNSTFYLSGDIFCAGRGCAWAGVFPWLVVKIGWAPAGLTQCCTWSHNPWKSRGLGFWGLQHAPDRPLGFSQPPKFCCNIWGSQIQLMRFSRLKKIIHYHKNLISHVILFSTICHITWKLINNKTIIKMNMFRSNVTCVHLFPKNSRLSYIVENFRPWHHGANLSNLLLDENVCTPIKGYNSFLLLH
ncbi:hypothetical protein VP01_966g2 [Puccinia sorghi]|uniref:Uncharacterized protein n=1 Tax=Puccinia sorghi TaxID=27349 RepID=A0A0L6U862_9BASI|nr:hypothetical protein VP01_966g2 [Puccinia sorghi]